MKKVMLFLALALMLTGCEVMDDMTWSEQTNFKDSMYYDGYRVDSYETRTYSNFTGINAGIQVDFYVYNLRSSQDLCVRATFSRSSAGSLRQGGIYRISPNGNSWVASVSTWNAQDGARGFSYEVTTQTGRIESYESCDRIIF
ncbi:hypothetical protein CWE11_03045 [Aliidiomarina sanyensis]|uniref:Lipoprotein n=1 Tax=Aliidiomarina sanyensis TaxID=1249555 RepID=A0A432WPR1_9GAMM|nr:hypothetical protein [Aliidiomarina sanyensis]RUO35751.1 hypothetical protein CWE11_03045 [Aliidiomarina sanyensis]